ncbi:MAG: glycosyltransferase family 4 protein [Elusimicrobia bacterium]|nr:glycosyltransferase family 4 protein [Candidatus Liberimonas magnetica]
MAQDKHKTNVLIVGYLPPPQEGTAKMTEVIINSRNLNEEFNLIFISLLKKKRTDLKGKVDLSNIYNNIINIARFLLLNLIKLPGLVYIPLAQNRIGFLRDSAFILIARVLGRKLCVHFHGGNFDRFYEFQGMFFRKYIDFVMKKVDFLIVLADKFKSQFAKYVTRDKIFTLYNCVPDIEKEKAEQSGAPPAGAGGSFDDATSRLPPTPTPGSSQWFSCGGNNSNSVRTGLTVFYLSYISKAKGALDLVEAIPKVLSKYKKPVNFILCGQPIDIERNLVFVPEPDHAYSKILKLVEENGLTKYVKIITDYSQIDKSIFFTEADIFVFTPYSEGCGLVALEAASYGLPIITNKVGALEEMFKEGENCLFVERPGDVDSLAEKIVYLLNDAELRGRITANNKKASVERFSKSKYCRDLGNIFNEILNYKNLNINL